jgi:phage tail-like protein
MPSARATAQNAGASEPDPVGELRFQVVVDDEQTIGAFAECSGLSAEYDVFEYAEGGQLDFVHKFRGGLKYPNLVLKRGITYETAFLDWFMNIAQTDREKRGNVTLVLLGEDGQKVRSWSFISAFPVKWTGPSLSSKSTNIAMETLEIAHQGLSAGGS